MRVLVHIGWHKTGTTAVQKFLHSNRHALREHYGLNYPDSGLHKVAHNLLPWSLNPARFKRASGLHLAAPEALVEDMLQETGRRGLDRIIVSSESFSFLPPSRLERLAQALRGHDLAVLAYVRRQDRYLESVYNQMVKDDLRRCTLSFHEFLRTRVARGGLDYASHFSSWEALFGRRNIRVRLYERSTLRGGDIRSDFCQLLGLSGTDRLVFKDTSDNPSLDFDSVHFLSRMNGLDLPQNLREKLLRLLKQRGAAGRPARLLDPRERRDLLARFRESNQKFAADYLGGPSALELDEQELARDRDIDFTYGRQQFVATLAGVLPQLLRVSADAGREHSRA